MNNFTRIRGQLLEVKNIGFQLQYFIQEKENKNCKSISRKGIF